MNNNMKINKNNNMNNNIKINTNINTILFNSINITKKTNPELEGNGERLFFSMHNVQADNVSHGTGATQCHPYKRRDAAPLRLISWLTFGLPKWPQDIVEALMMYDGNQCPEGMKNFRWPATISCLCLLLSWSLRTLPPCASLYLRSFIKDC